MIKLEKDAPQTINLFQALATHKRPMMLTFSGIMLIAIAATFLSRKTYTSEAKLFVRLGRESVALDPTTTATTSQVVMVQESREFEINSVFEVLKSRAVLADVVAAVGPHVVLGTDEEPEGVQKASMLQSLNLSSPTSIEDRALKRLNKDLTIAAIKKSNILNITYDAPSPELARDVVAQVIRQARDAHIRVNRTDGSQEFFAAQVEQLRDKVATLETQYRDLKNQSGISSLEDQRVLKLKQISELHGSLLTADAALAASAAEMQAQKALLETIPQTVTIGHTTGMPQAAVSSMREQLFTAQVREKDLLSRLTKDHPLALAATQQVTALQAVIDEEPVLPQVAQGPNPAHQEIHLARLKGEALGASLKAQSAALRDQMAAAQKDLSNLNDHEIQMAKLEREIDRETTNYKRYSENLEQSRIDHELVMQNISNLNVLQEPSYSITPTKPRRSITLAMGFVAAFASSLAVGLFLEQRRTGRLFPVAAAPSWSGATVDAARGRFEQQMPDNPWSNFGADGGGDTEKSHVTEQRS